MNKEGITIDEYIERENSVKFDINSEHLKLARSVSRAATGEHAGYHDGQ
jgi:hypothetical protein